MFAQVIEQKQVEFARDMQKKLVTSKSSFRLTLTKLFEDPKGAITQHVVTTSTTHANKHMRQITRQIPRVSHEIDTAHTTMQHISTACDRAVGRVFREQRKAVQTQVSIRARKKANKTLSVPTFDVRTAAARVCQDIYIVDENVRESGWTRDSERFQKNEIVVYDIGVTLNTPENERSPFWHFAAAERYLAYV